LITKLLQEIEDLVSQSGKKDPLFNLRMKTLKAGLKAAEGMEDDPRLIPLCLDILIITIELYAELAIFAQDGSQGVSDSEDIIANSLKMFKEKIEA
jgi:hypothetical protein